MININATLIIQLIQFLILVFILNRLMLRPILRIVDERGKHLEKTRRDTINIEEETRDLIDKCISMERNARRDAMQASSQLRREAVKIAEKTFEDTREQALSIKEKVMKEVDEKLNHARQSLQEEAMVLAEAMTDKFIGRRAN